MYASESFQEKEKKCKKGMKYQINPPPFKTTLIEKKKKLFKQIKSMTTYLPAHAFLFV